MNRSEYITVRVTPDTFKKVKKEAKKDSKTLSAVANNILEKNYGNNHNN